VRHVWGLKVIFLNPLRNILGSSCCNTSYWVITLFVNRDFLATEKEQCFSRDLQHASCLCKLRFCLAGVPTMTDEKIPAHFVAFSSFHSFWRHCLLRHSHAYSAMKL
jgi:hypothetical protein